MRNTSVYIVASIFWVYLVVSILALLYFTNKSTDVAQAGIEHAVYEIPFETDLGMATCYVRLGCGCDYAIKTKTDGTLVCREVNCKYCKDKWIPPTFTSIPIPTWIPRTNTPVLTATDTQEPYPSPLPYP